MQDIETERRAGDRRIAERRKANDSGYVGPERRIADRRKGDRRQPE